MNYLSKELYSIKKFAKFNLLTFSDHAKMRISERKLDEETILDIVKKPTTSIVEVHAPGEYHNNKDEVFVLFNKFMYKGRSKPIHIIVAKEVSKNAGRNYKIITSYIPNKHIWYAYGRVLKEKHNRYQQ